MSDDRLNTFLDSIDDDTTGYSRKQVLADACRNPRARVTTPRPTLNNVLDRAVIAEYVEYVARADAEPVEREIVTYIPPANGLRLVWDTPEYGLQLIEVDARFNGKVYVYGYLPREIEPGWFYEALPEDAAIMPAPDWLIFAEAVDPERVARMRQITVNGNPDSGWQQERYEDLYWTLRGYR